jgi:hypothetical protein
VEAAKVQNHEEDEVNKAYALVKNLRLSRQRAMLQQAGLDASTAARDYRRWLALRRAFPHLSIAPTVNIDRMWHAHILDTRTYERDCARVFGQFLHHTPFRGKPADFKRTQSLWRRYFGEDIEGTPAVCD